MENTTENRKALIQKLLVGKTRFLAVDVGVRSVWRLSNGWIAVRREPRNGWRDTAYWSFYRSNIEYQTDKRPFAGSPGTLATALDIALRTEAGEFAPEGAIP
jgi:hypothetical protein